MSLFTKRADNQVMQPWSKTIDLAAIGQGPAGLFSLYDSLGDVTITGAQTFVSLLDGPEVVKRYGALTIGDGSTTTSYTASQRCKGGVILCDTLLVKNAATLNMTGKGARVDRNDDPFFPFVDFRIPFQVSLSSDRVTLAKALAIIKANGFAPWDQGTWQDLVTALMGFNLSVTQAGSMVLMLASGCGRGGNTTGYSSASAAGENGVAGTNGGMGGGGQGGVWTGIGAGKPYPAGSGCPYGGGCGSGACSSSTILTGCPCSKYSGPGGHSGGHVYSGPFVDVYPGDAKTNAYYGGAGAGNPSGTGGSPSGNVPAGEGVGGKLVIIARTSVTVQSGGKIESNGKDGGGTNNGYAGGGASGGGHISIITPSYSNAGTVQAAGGTGGDQGYPAGKGGNGGAGSVVTKTFADMGW